jgi:tetratricopeptide (TPR) repeat protein
MPTSALSLPARLILALVLLGLVAMSACFFAYRLAYPTLLKKTAAVQSGKPGSVEADADAKSAAMRRILDLMHKIRAGPDSYALRLEIADAFIALEDWKSAVAHLEKALEINPGEVAAYQYMALCLLNLERYAEAADFAGRAAKLREGR